MKKLGKESGSVLVFVTLMIVLLMFMVGMGLDTGWLTFSRSMGQRAVDMAALSGVAGLAKGDATAVKDNVEATINDYVKLSGNPIIGTVGGKNVTLVKYDSATGTITPETDIVNANGVRVALETTNPYTGGASASAINTGHFLTPLLNLLGIGSAPAATDINVSAVAVYSAIPGIPLALGKCTPGVQNIFFQTPSGGANPNNSAWTTYMVNETNTPDLIKRIKAIVSCQGGGEASVGTPICVSNGQNTPVVQEFELLADPDGNKCYFTPVVADQTTFTGCTAEENKIKSWAEVCIKYVCAPPDSNKNPNCDKDIGEKYIIANVKRCDLTDSDRVGQCFRHSLIREKAIGM
ncbi:MAG TPA: pilus assembly protein TadG-related protein [Candidatus Binatia bacterium]|jgi:Flp pilus assembly protein TadG|nr:pilus assembly protein TadG-related protein [Candidatus Binatia bacterium]